MNTQERELIRRIIVRLMVADNLGDVSEEINSLRGLIGVRRLEGHHGEWKRWDWVSVGEEPEDDRGE